MTFDDWVEWEWATPRQATREEIANLLALAERDLQECQAEGLGADWKLAIGYNAALQFATAALAAVGYRAARDAHHYRVVQSLALTLGWDSGSIKTLDSFRRKRHIVGYERPGAASDEEAEEMLGLSRRLQSEVRAWLAAAHPEFL